MTEWNKEFPKPDRSNFKPQQNANAEFLPERDIARSETVMNDGRPAVFEDWWDYGFHLGLRTTFYSTIGIENWSETDHYSYVEANGLLKGKTHPSQDVGLRTMMDASGNKCWSASIVMSGGEE
jgi:hypothetical protein